MFQDLVRSYCDAADLNWLDADAEENLIDLKAADAQNPWVMTPPTPGGVPGLFNINIDARLFVCMSRRSILCICRNASQDPASYFLPTLVDICETVRARWHALVIVNKLMDGQTREFATLRGTALERHQRLKSVRMMLASSLEDPTMPTMYTVAGDALSRIVDDLSKMLRLDNLRSALLGKMDLIDRIYSDARELEWLQEGPLEKKNR